MLPGFDPVSAKIAAASPDNIKAISSMHVIIRFILLSQGNIFQCFDAKKICLETILLDF